jgi:hypothetical protein
MKWLALTLLMLVGSGCGSQATVQKFNVSFSDAEKSLRTLYPTTMGDKQVDELPAGAAKFDGRLVDIRRDELPYSKQTIVITEQNGISKFRDDYLHRTSVVFKSVDGGCEVEVQTPRNNKAVLMPSRDEAYEQKQMNQIAEALNKK